MNSLIEIKETELVKTYTIKYVRITVIDVILNTSALIMYELFSNNDERVDSNSFRLSGEDYQNWGTDDQYLVDLVMQRIGFESNVPA